MRSLFKLFFFSFLILPCLHAETKSTARISDMGKYTNITLPAPFGGQTSAGTFMGKVNGINAQFYCIDITHPLAMNQDYHDVSATGSKVTYILNNYYPYKALPYTGSIAESKEAAAVQVSIWYFTDNLKVSDLSDHTIRDRALQIIADANANAGTIQPFKTLLIRMPHQSFNVGSPIEFYVEAYNEVGAPIPNVDVALGVNEGTLSAATVRTNATGVAGPVYLTAGPNNSSIISASAAVTIPHGTEYRHVADPNGRQKLVIATPVTAMKAITSTVNWYNYVNLTLEKTSKSIVINNGDEIEYSIKVTNTSQTNASGVKVTDKLPNILEFAGTDGEYNNASGIWNVGELAAGESKTLKVIAKANYSGAGAESFDLGVASDYNLFVLNDLNQPSSDTEGKVAVGHDAVLSGYSVGDKLAPASGDVLVVGRKLTFKSGRVYNGNVVFGSFIDTTHWNLSDGTIRQDNVVDFNAASVYLNNLSNQISTLQTTGTDTVIYGHLMLNGTNPVINKFFISAEDIRSCNDFTIDVPANSIALVNVSGDSVVWSGGFNVTGATNENVLLNFYEAKYIKISGIDIRASVLAPRAVLDFPHGLISGQVVVYDMIGAGQVNNIRFKGKITLDITITNFAEIVSCDQPLEIQGCMPLSKKQITRTISGSATGVNMKQNVRPEKYELLQNYPNPFNPSTKIGFMVKDAGNYTLKVYNMLGQNISTLVNGYLKEGSYEMSFNASNLSSGVYIYELAGEKIRMVQKMILSK